MRKLLVLALVSVIAGCTNMMHAEKVDSGQVTIGERLEVKVEGAWNHFNSPQLKPAEAWTMEGLPIDALLIYSGVKDGEAVHPLRSSEQKNFTFRSNMQPDEIVSMFEGSLTRDGSTFKLAKLEPASFGGTKGLRFEYAMVRKIDNVQLQGVGYACINSGELFAMLYSAPRLGFFARQQSRVEEIARSAKVRPAASGGT